LHGSARPESIRGGNELRTAMTQGSTAYVQSAPRTLIAFHRRSTGSGRDLLGRLLSDDCMQRPWRVLERRIKNEHDFIRLWSDIRSAVLRSRRPLPGRSAVRDAYLEIAEHTRRLAETIKSGPLDVLAFELFSLEDIRLLGISDWPEEDALQRNERAHTLLSHWPSSVDLLCGLAYQAEKQAVNAMQSARPVERKTRDSQAIFLARVIATNFRRRFGQPLYGTVAGIVQVIIRKPVTKAFVQRAVSRQAGGSDYSIP
jgi:hypothetical protein